MNIGAEFLAVLLRIHEVPDPNFGAETGYYGWDKM
jgi:hypothetical protein